MNLYKRIFENALTKDMPPMDASDDAAVFENGFENEEDFNNIENETEKITLSPEEISEVVQRGMVYKAKIDSFIKVLSDIQADVSANKFKSVESKAMKKFEPYIKDLTILGLSLTAGVKDGVIAANDKIK